jgi:hypothetical protein
MARVPDNVIEALRGSHELGIFLRLDTDDPMRVWLGINDIPAGIDSIDPSTSERYVGGGVLREVPSLEAVINGIADRADFQISGIDPATAAKVDFDALDVRGRDFHVGVTTLDEDHQPMSSIISLITGRASYLTEASPPVTGIDNPSVTMGLSVGFGITTRDRQSQVLWSPVHHKAEHPGDLLCDGVSRLERGVAPVWPRF